MVSPHCHLGLREVFSGSPLDYSLDLQPTGSALKDPMEYSLCSLSSVIWVCMEYSLGLNGVQTAGPYVV